MLNIEEKTVFITGASRGIGAAAARHFAGLGANVMMMARSGNTLSELQAELGDNSATFTGDVANYDDVNAAILQAQAQFGTIDIVINNAGLIDPIAHLAAFDPADWDRVIDVNVKGVFYAMRSAIPLMLAQAGRGTIINISSGAAYNALEGWSHYCASKAAVLQLTRAGHKEYVAQGIRVIGLSPGTIATQMQVDIRASGINPVSQMEMSDHNPPEMVAQLMVALCGPEGDAYCGQDISLSTPEGARLMGLTDGYFG